MKLENESFHPALQRIAAIANRGHAYSPSLILLEAASGLFRMAASDGGEYAIAEIECEGDLNPVCVPSQSLQNIALLFGENVTIDKKENRVLVRSSGSYVMNGVASDQFTTPTLDNLTKVGVNCQDLVEGIERVKFASAKQDARPGLFGVHCRLLPTEIICSASTGLAMARYQKSSICAEGDFLIPHPFVGNMVAALKQDGAVLSVSDKRLLVSFTGGCYSCALTEAKFPDMETPIKREHPDIGEFKPSEWLPVFRTILGMAGENGKMRCEVNIDGGRVKYQGESGSVDRAIDKLSKPLRLNAATFTSCLEAFKDQTVTASLYGDGEAFRMDCGELAVLTTQLKG